jgi:hypothetical protein
MHLYQTDAYVGGHCHNFRDPGDIPLGAFRGTGLGLGSESAGETTFEKLNSSNRSIGCWRQCWNHKTADCATSGSFPIEHLRFTPALLSAL